MKIPAKRNLAFGDKTFEKLIIIYIVSTFAKEIKHDSIRECKIVTKEVLALRTYRVFTAYIYWGIVRLLQGTFVAVYLNKL